VADLVGRDQAHGLRDNRIPCPSGLPETDGSSERLAHASLHLVLDNDLGE
jgi:hypothetical protein